MQVLLPTGILVVLQQGAAGGILGQGVAHQIPQQADKGQVDGLAQGLTQGGPRITSYNVCYTKLLRHARNLSAAYGAPIYLKREDLNHTGAHKIRNNFV